MTDSPQLAKTDLAEVRKRLLEIALSGKDNDAIAAARVLFRDDPTATKAPIDHALRDLVLDSLIDNK